jgi:hypothetical protein
MRLRLKVMVDAAAPEADELSRRITDPAWTPFTASPRSSGITPTYRTGWIK